jgi:hypothetical protein
VEGLGTFMEGLPRSDAIDDVVSRKQSSATLGAALE